MCWPTNKPHKLAHESSILSSATYLLYFVKVYGMFQRNVVLNFAELMDIAIRRCPHESLLSMNILWRATNLKNPTSVAGEVINFTSYLIEHFPNISCYPIKLLPNIIDLEQFIKP